MLTVGEVQGPTRDAENRRDRPLAARPGQRQRHQPQLYDVRGVITQKTLARTSAGADQYGFFLQSRAGATDGDPLSSDGIFVFMGAFTSLIGGYVPTVGDEVRAARPGCRSTSTRPSSPAPRWSAGSPPGWT